MRLSKFQIVNFKNLSNIEFNWEDIIVLIGENNTGKSSVLEALYWFLSGKQISDDLLFRNKLSDEGNAIELIGTFDQLTEEDRRQIAIQGRTYEEKWILKKKYWINSVNGKDKAESKYFSRGEVETFLEWPENERSWNNWPDSYSDLIEEVKANLGARVTSDAKERLKELVKSEKTELVEIELGWIPDPGGGQGWKSNANSILPKYILVPAVYDASIEGKSKERQSMTTYGEILNLLIEKKLTNKPEVRELKAKIDQVKALFQPNPENPDWEQAQEIIEFQNDLSALLSKVIESKATLEPGDISISEIVLPNTTLWINDGFKTKIDGQGHGLQRTLIMSLLQMLVDYENIPISTEENAEANSEGNSFVRSIIFSIEEPELYMHPQMERKMRDTLYDLSGADNYQVICCTHSPVFIDMAEKHTAIVRLEIDGNRNVTPTQVMEEIFTGEDASDKKKRLRMITNFDPAVNELFFAKRVVLVEGDTEIAVFQRAAELMGLFDTNPHAKRDATFINCHGKWTILLFLEVLNHFGVEYVVFHDEDSDKGGNVLQANQAIGQLVQLPNERRMFSPNDLESVLGYDATSKDKPIKALEKVEELMTLGSIPAEFQEHVRVAWGI